MKTPSFQNSIIPELIVTVFLTAMFSLISIPSTAADGVITEDTDLSKMDWSDESEQQEKDYSKESWEDEAAEIGEDLSKMSWEDEPVMGKEQDLSEMNWADEEGENSFPEGELPLEEISQTDEKARALMERNTHIFGFLFFFLYILGGLFTAYFSRNRKVAIDYPPELLILLHSVWPVEWIFMLFAGKKVR